MKIPSWAGIKTTCFGWDAYVQPYAWKKYVEEWRKPSDVCPEGCYVLNYTNNPLIVNEMQYEECTFVVIENGKIILTNFTDLYDAEGAQKAFYPGEFWVSYCEGGAERNLRFGPRG